MSRSLATLFVRGMILLLHYTLLLALSLPAWAGVRIPNFISDNMVLQQNANITLWGWSCVGNEVEVKTSWGESTTAHAMADGSWRVKIKTPKAHPLSEGLHPETITITMPSENMIQVRNVLIGEVWLCSGQSNMEMMLRPGYPPGWNGWYGEAYWKNEESKNANRPYLRVYDVEKTSALSPQPDVKGFLPAKGIQPENANGFIRGREAGWQTCTPESAEYISAVAYYFAVTLAEKLQVPIGVITSDVGGTPIRTWMQGGDYYNGMIAPFFSMKFQGVIWYQGESDVGDPTGSYATLFNSMIEDWRKKFDNEDMPFYFVQIAPFGTNPAEAQLREEQTSALTLKNTGMVVTSDVSDTSCVHPKDKRDVGRRLAWQALRKTYGRSDIVADGPTFQSLHIVDGKIHVTFSNQGYGLISRDRKPLTCFTVASADGKFVPATAEIVGTEVVVSCPDVPQPTELRFGWGGSDQPNLMSKNGLPAAQFSSALH